MTGSRGWWGWMIMLVWLVQPNEGLSQGVSPAQVPVQPENSTAKRLETGLRAFEQGGYLAAVEQLSGLLYPLKLTDKREIVTAKATLGMAYYVLGRRAEAGQEFRAIFRMEPTWRPDPLKVPPELVAFIEKQRPAPPRPQVVQGIGETLPTQEFKPPESKLVNLLPLGIPQFLNGDRTRGLLYASLQTTLLAVNVGSYWYLRQGEGTVPADETEYRQRQGAKVVNIASLSVLTVTWVVGMGDAWVSYSERKPPLGLQVGPAGAVQLSFSGAF